VLFCAIHRLASGVMERHISGRANGARIDQVME